VASLPLRGVPTGAPAVTGFDSSGALLESTPVVTIGPALLLLPPTGFDIGLTSRLSCGLSAMEVESVLLFSAGGVAAGTLRSFVPSADFSPMVRGATPLTGLLSCGAPDSDFSVKATGAVAVVAEETVGAGSPAKWEISVDVRSTFAWFHRKRGRGAGEGAGSGFGGVRVFGNLP